MKKPFLFFSLILAFVFTRAQEWNYKPAGELTNFIGIVHVENDFVFIGSGTDEGKRYCGDWLDEKLKKDGQRIKLSGIIGAIPPNVRMRCTPLKITKAAAVETAPEPAEKQGFKFDMEHPLKNIKATIKLLNNGELFVLVPDNNASMRYISEQLPAEFKKDGLRVTFSGWEGIIPPNFRMMGKPLKLKSICITKAEQKKNGIKKAKYTFK